MWKFKDMSAKGLNVSDKYQKESISFLNFSEAMVP